MHKLFVASFVLLSLAACSNGGHKFEGKWTCQSALGQINAIISNNDGDNYIFRSNMVTYNLTYKDGKLIGPTTFMIDKKTDKLVGLNICEMSRVK